MKKFFVALSFIAALVFVSTPSMALIGSPDPVTATNILQPFFLVSFDGNLDTVVTLTNTKSATLYYHWIIFDKRSVHRANGDLKFTEWDVIPISIRNDILPLVGSAGLKEMEVDLNNDGVNDHWMGYLTYESYSWDVTDLETVDPLMGQMYLLDLQHGLASGCNLAGRELAQRGDSPFDVFHGDGYWFLQNSFLSDEWLPPIGTLPYPEFTDFEAFTAFAYATSKAREAGYNPHDNGIDLPIPAYMRLVPRWFLLNDSAETYVMLWSSGNWGKWEQDGLFDPDTYSLIVDVCNEDEICYSGQINIPYELNFINIRTVIPGAWNALEPIGGWVDIAWYFNTKQLPVAGWDYPWYYSAVPLAAEWLAYSYQFAQSPNGSLNWGALFEVHRDVGTLVEGLPALLVDNN
jgi:hypothetical protein